MSNVDQQQLIEQAQQEVKELRSKITQLDDNSIDLILRRARSHYAWTDKPIDKETLLKLYNIMASGPTSMNTCPARVVFVTSAEGKDRLALSLKEKNIDKMKSAPVTAIIAFDLSFWEKLPFLFPHEDRRGFFKDKAEYSYDTAYRNSTLQGAYFMIGARALGLDVGAMSGFSNEVVDKEFFSESGWKSNFLCNIGYADETALFQKLPRFSFDDVCSFA